ncbi:5-enolpyruvylshikimate-3-phosphate synthase [Geomicrobium sp. JCM 19037]|uniref:3-phosphoshikimate 1-carboxyvinyltransferase n=1 Tax=Geomicrobium sp. JCM 19037 TaxID=1460634 RepID=UPI00045F180B|nr:3-phosphoshikimate 1-carboxyvinyltransferase [Geomicrobium sp. JCM 19037]GAK02431.1 5-enolpyruvylshikimate-3-phosphate synthase [Geomicrobium sp. JCM 19037]
MTTQVIQRARPLTGAVSVPGDKSISHRAVMFGSIAHGTTRIRGFLQGEDCKSTIHCFRQLGVNIQEVADEIVVEGKGLEGLTEPKNQLDVGNSGTTIRLIMGILAGAPFFSTVAGDASIAKRPMARVTEPLVSMGAQIWGRDEANLTPLAIRGTKLHGKDYTTRVASAQVKSSILLAGLFADGQTSVTEPSRSRDHTERMLGAFGAKLDVQDTRVTIAGNQTLQSADVNVPGDISSAAFLLAAATLVPDSKLRINETGMNPTRAGIIDVLKAMGGQLNIENERIESGEPVADFVVHYANLVGTTIDRELIPRLIDEIPVIAVLATQAEGTTIIKDAEELKYKETNRIDTVVNQLNAMGANIEATSDGMIVHGPTPLTGCEVESFGDHRIAMAFAVAGLVASGETIVNDAGAADVSFPNFFKLLQDVQS